MSVGFVAAFLQRLIKERKGKPPPEGGGTPPPLLYDTTDTLATYYLQVCESGDGDGPDSDTQLGWSPGR